MKTLLDAIELHPEGEAAREHVEEMNKRWKK